MFALLVLFATVATATVVKYETVLKEGVQGVAIQHHETVGIPHKQCSGLIKSELDYPCAPGSYLAVLKVSISNEGAIPKVTFNDGLARASIYRSGSCSGEALVEIGWTCLPFYPPHPKKNKVHNKDTHEFHKGISNRLCDGGGCNIVHSAGAHRGLSKGTCGGAGCRRPRSVLPDPNTEKKEKSESHNAPAESPVPNIKIKGKRHVRDYFRNLSQRTCDGSTCGNRRIVNSYKSSSHDDTQDVPSVRICDGSDCKRAQSKIEDKSHESEEVPSQRLCDGAECAERRRRHEGESRRHKPHGVARGFCGGSGCRNLHHHQLRYRNQDDLSQRMCDGSGCRVVPSPPLNLSTPQKSDETEDVIVHRICNGSSCKTLPSHHASPKHHQVYTDV